MSTDPQARPADPIVGIDLGTTNSLVAHCTEAGPVILESPEGLRSLPSVVRLLASADGSYTVEALGHHARQHAVEFPTTTFHSIKRLMGRSVADLADDLPHLPYPVVEGPHHTARVALPHLPKKPTLAEHGSATPHDAPPSARAISPLTLTPQEISAIYLRELKRWAEAALQTSVTRAVVTVPAYFDDAQRQATRDAGRLAGLNVLRIVNEPTAAALAYGLGLESPSKPQAANLKPQTSPKKPTLAERGSIPLNTKPNPEACASPEKPQALSPAPQAANLNAQGSSQTIALYDLGGGTFDVSILRLQQTATGTLDQVLATDGDTHLGGDDFDQALVQLFQSEIRTQLGQPQLAFPPATQQAFRTLAEQTKIKLSTDDQATLEIDLTDLAHAHPNTTLSAKPTLAEHGANSPQTKNRKPQTPTLYQRTLTRDEFNQLITPLIDRTLDACQRALKNANLKLPPTTATAAAPEILPVAGVDRVILVGGSTRIPLVREKITELFQREPYTALNPDEVVALGASVQAAVLAGIKRDTLLLDVIPLSLGIETLGGAVAKLITANTTIPARATERFSTHADGQTSVKIHVLQGERELVKDCRSLATFDLTGVPPMPAGLPKINVTFLIDANGVLSVQATEERSGRRAHVQVIPNHGLTREEITQIENDSFTHARADMAAHRLIDLRLNAKLDIRNIQKQLDRFPPPETPQAPEAPEALETSASPLHPKVLATPSERAPTPKKPTPTERGSNPPQASSPTPQAANPHPQNTLPPAYRAEIQQHLANVQQHIDTPDADNDADAFQQALHNLDHATLRLAELNIARTLRESAEGT